MEPIIIWHDYFTTQLSYTTPLRLVVFGMQSHRIRNLISLLVFRRTTSYFIDILFFTTRNVSL